MSTDDELDPSDWLAAHLGEPAPKPAVAPPIAAPSGGFSWSLTPGAEPPTALPPAQEPESAPAAYGAFEQPTVAMPAFEQPTAPFTAFEQPTVAMPAYGAPGNFAGQDLEYVAPDPSRWLAAPIDPALDGATEVFEAELVGLTGLEGESLPASALDDLFGDGQFHDFTDEPLIAPLPSRTGGGSSAQSAGSGVVRRPRTARAPIPRTQKILMVVAGVLVAALALVALYATGLKLASLAPAPVMTPTATPTPTANPGARPVGPLSPGDYHWDQLLGGECLAPFESAWQDNYTVVDCTVAHPAQLVYRGTFTDPASATFPGVAELQKRTPLLCTAPTVINYAAAGAVQDIQIRASYAVDEKDWDGGYHDYFCFVNRSGGGTMTASVAIAQVAVTPTPTPTPSVSSTPGARGPRGHAQGTKTAP